MTIRIATFNLRQRSFTEDGTDTGDRAWSARLPAAADYVVRSGAALLALQEVDFSPAPSQQLELATAVSDLTGHTWAVVDAGSGNVGGYMFDTTQVTRLEGGFGPGYFEYIDPAFSGDRRMTWARFYDVGGQYPFWLIRVHMPTTTATTPDLWSDMYTAAANIVSDRADALAATGDRVLIAGDMNHHTYPQAAFAARGYVDVRTLAPITTDNRPRSFNGFDPDLVNRLDGRWIDGVFLRGTNSGWVPTATGLISVWADGANPPIATPMPSDHFPLFVTLEQSDVEPPLPPPTPPPVALVGDTAQRLFCGEVVSGRYVQDLTSLVTSGTWSVALNAVGSIEATFPLRGLSSSQVEGLLALLEPWRCYLGVSAGDRIVEAGPIQGPAEYDDGSGMLRVKAAGIESIFSKRTVLRAASVIDAIDGTIDDGISVRRSEVEVNDASLGTIAKRYVQNTLAMPGGFLPIVLPPDEAGVEDRLLYGYDMPNLADELDELRSAGVDIAFEPRFTADGEGVEWVMRVGTNADSLLHQAGDPWIWDLTRPNGPGAGLSVSSDSSMRTNLAWASGEGQQYALPQSVQVNGDQWAAGYPLLEDVAAYTDTGALTVLRAHARSTVEEGAFPWTTLTTRVRITTAPAWGEFRPGDWSMLIVPEGHPLVAAGERLVRVVSIRGQIGSTFAGLGFMATREAR